jgi:hypothetical protein
MMFLNTRRQKFSVNNAYDAINKIEDYVAAQESAETIARSLLQLDDAAQVYGKVFRDLSAIAKEAIINRLGNDQALVDSVVAIVASAKE